MGVCTAQQNLHQNKKISQHRPQHRPLMNPINNRLSQKLTESDLQSSNIRVRLQAWQDILKIQAQEIINLGTRRKQEINKKLKARVQQTKQKKMKRRRKMQSKQQQQISKKKKIKDIQEADQGTNKGFKDQFDILLNMKYGITDKITRNKQKSKQIKLVPNNQNTFHSLQQKQQQVGTMKINKGFKDEFDILLSTKYGIFTKNKQKSIKVKQFALKFHNNLNAFFTEPSDTNNKLKQDNTQINIQHKQKQGKSQEQQNKLQQLIRQNNNWAHHQRMKRAQEQDQKRRQQLQREREQAERRKQQQRHEQQMRRRREEQDRKRRQDEQGRQDDQRRRDDQRRMEQQRRRDDNARMLRQNQERYRRQEQMRRRR